MNEVINKRKYAGLDSYYYEEDCVLVGKGEEEDGDGDAGGSDAEDQRGAEIIENEAGENRSNHLRKRL